MYVVGDRFWALKMQMLLLFFALYLPSSPPSLQDPFSISLSFIFNICRFPGTLRRFIFVVPFQRSFLKSFSFRSATLFRARSLPFFFHHSIDIYCCCFFIFAAPLVDQVSVIYFIPNQKRYVVILVVFRRLCLKVERLIWHKDASVFPLI